MSGRHFEFPPAMAEHAFWFDEWMLGLRFPQWVDLEPERVDPRKRSAFAIWTGIWERLPIEIGLAQLKRRF